MSIQTVTRTVETDFESDALYGILSEAANIPKWAPVFADAIEHIDGRQYRVTKDGETFSIEVLLHPSAVAVDYVREMPNGRRGGAYIRVTPRPLGGSTIIMTVPIGRTASESEVAKALEQELTALLELARS